MKFQVIPVEKIIPDPDVQFEWTFREPLVRRMALNYDPQLAGVIDVIPLNGDRKGLYGVFVGRHRHAAASLSGEKSMRCDVWPESLTASEKHRIKLGKDRDRRTTKRIEIFLNEVGAKEPAAVEIVTICEAYGYEVGRCSAGKPYTRIEAVNALLVLHTRNTLSRTLSLNSLWRDEPKTNGGTWLLGLGAAVAEGWTDRISAQGYERLRALIPLKVQNEAIALASMPTTLAASRPSEVSRLIAERLRKTAKVRKRGSSVE